MRTRRGTLAAAGTAAATLAGCTGRSEGPVSGDDEDGPREGHLEAASDAFDDGDGIPARYTCDGEDVSPPLELANVPEEATTLAIVVDDPDAPGDAPFVHWLLWDLPVEGGGATVPQDVPDGESVAALGGPHQGRNDMDAVGYRGPCPPAGETHSYRFRVHAVDGELGLEGGADRAAFEAALDGRVVDRGLLTGTYRRA